jgi:hypothetical protein
VLLATNLDDGADFRSRLRLNRRKRAAGKKPSLIDEPRG